jgi:hypothetical protein
LPISDGGGIHPAALRWYGESLLIGQEHLEKKLDILETHQNEIHNALLSMEGEADQLYRFWMQYFPVCVVLIVPIQLNGKADARH